MMHRVIIEPRAAEDIVAYASWIRAEGSPQNALRWIEGIEEAIGSLAVMPSRCPVAPESETLGMEIRELFFKSHRVLFVVRAESVHVLHIRHGARLPLRPE